MKTLKHSILSLLCAFVLLANLMIAPAQEKTKSANKSSGSNTFVVEDGHALHFSAEGHPGGWMAADNQEGGFLTYVGDDHTFEFVSTEMMFYNKPIKNAPYSAEAVTEKIQLLADGNRIVRRETTTLYRDSEGRTRRDQTFSRTRNSDASDMVSFISDPVSGFNYTLHHKDRQAFKQKNQTFNIKLRETSKDGIVIEEKISPADKSEVEKAVRARLRPLPQGEPPAGGVSVFVGPDSAAKKLDRKQESLGQQMVEGVMAEGSRSTITIPAGEIGNEQPINIVSERWYSPELQLVVMHKRTDPRQGETIYRLTNINRNEPARSLFEAPADFTVQEGFPRRRPQSVIREREER